MRAGKHKDVFVAQFSDQNSLIFGTSKVVFFSFHFFKIAVKGKLLRSCSIKVALGGSKDGLMQ